MKTLNRIVPEWGSERGVSVIAAVVALLILGIMGAALVSVKIVSEHTRLAQVHKERAFYLWQAGQEYAFREVDSGGQPEVGSKYFADGTFTSDVVPRLYLEEVLNPTSSTTIEYVTTSTLGEECFSISVSDASIGGFGNRRLYGVKLRNEGCSDEVKLTHIMVAFFPNNGERLRRVYFDGWPVYMGSASSGEFADIVDVTLSDGSYHSLSPLVFSSDMSDKQIVLVARLSSNLLRVLGRFGESRVLHQSSIVLAADCFSLDTSSIGLGGAGNHRLEGFQIRKGDCVDLGTITTIEFNVFPDGGEKVVRVQFDGETVFDDPSGVASGQPVTINKTVSDTAWHRVSPIYFSSDLTGKQFLIIVTFSDTSFGLGVAFP